MFSTNTVTRLGYSIRGLIAGALVIAAGTGHARSLRSFIPESIGVRGGGAFSQSQTGEFYQTEAFADWNLPWKLESESGWFLQTKLTLSAGWLGGNGINAAEGTLAPALGLGKRHFPLWLEGGIGPTWISEYQFSTANFGEQLQFTSFLGVNVDITSHWRFGYRFQHMSNGDLATSNPGSTSICSP